MTAVRSRTRSLSAAVLLVGLLCATAACGTEAPSAAESDWEEPAAYTYTLTSSEGERALLGTFRVTVRDGGVAEAVGLDGSARRVVRDLPDQVPTISGLLAEMEQARRDGADRAEAE
ncbi:DUF6174 domain-containing protein [Streptomyces dysideae]|uniref:DUF6174 domain-containing protein n=1 Tax=Streptomyces dysideae TaxID=909626 RepID=UPI000AFFEABA|nr:DUF6174 domain-containing protein [Streptomyces dysideae]